MKRLLILTVILGMLLGQLAIAAAAAEQGRD